jgi:hypothetical protein
MFRPPQFRHDGGNEALELGRLPAVGVVQQVDGTRRRLVVGQHLHQASRAQVIAREVFGDECNADAVQSRHQDCCRVVQAQAVPDVDFVVFARAGSSR